MTAPGMQVRAAADPRRVEHKFYPVNQRRVTVAPAARLPATTRPSWYATATSRRSGRLRQSRRTSGTWSASTHPAACETRARKTNQCSRRPGLPASTRPHHSCTRRPVSPRTACCCWDASSELISAKPLSTWSASGCRVWLLDVYRHGWHPGKLGAIATLSPTIPTLTVMKRSAGLIRAGGTLVTVVGPPVARPVDGLAIDFVVESDRAQLGEIVQRVRGGRLRTNICNVATLDDAVATFNSTERRKGKTIIRVRT